MPIQFRCAYCQCKLSIARRKAGAEIDCPQCGLGIIVPDADANVELAEEIPQPEPIIPAPIAPPPVPPAVLKSSTATKKLNARLAPVPPPRAGASSEDPPLFEQHVEELLGATARPEGVLRIDDASKPRVIEGRDASSLKDPADLAPPSTSHNTTKITIGVMILIVLSFFAGFFVRSRI